MKNEETLPRRFRADRSFFIHLSAVILSSPGDDARYFQISVVLADGHHAAGQFGRGVAGECELRGEELVGARSTRVPSFSEVVWDAVESVPTFLESVPEVSAKLKEPETKERKFEVVVKSAEQAAVPVLVYWRSVAASR